MCRRLRYRQLLLIANPSRPIPSERYVWSISVAGPRTTNFPEMNERHKHSMQFVQPWDMTCAGPVLDNIHLLIPDQVLCLAFQKYSVEFLDCLSAWLFVIS